MSDRRMDSRRLLVAVEYAKRVRKAIETRTEQQTPSLVAYDRAIEKGNEEEIANQSLMLIIMLSSMVDPVAIEISKFIETDKILQAAVKED